MSESIDSPPTGGPAVASSRPSRAWRMRLLMLPVLILFMGVLVGGHWYIAHRLILAPELPSAFSTVLLFAMGILGVFLVLQPIAERFMPASVERFIVWPATIWMGVAFLLLMALFMTDLVMVLLGFGAAGEGPVADRVRAAGVVALVLPASLIALREGLSLPAVRRVDVALARWPAALDGFKIVQISDIHFGPILNRRFAAWLTDRINGLSPDLIALTGDLVDGPVDKVRHEVEPLAQLRARHGRYFVTGNHDHYSGADPWVSRVVELGFEPLRNEHRTREIEGARFVIAGVDDYRSRQMPGEGGEDLSRALEGVDPELPVVLLAHDPTTFKRASKRSVDLQISGHTHGGQIWPFGYMVRLAVPWVAGLYRVGAATLYVSRGTGFWGPPMRLGAPAEITELVLHPAPESAGAVEAAGA